MRMDYDPEAHIELELADGTYFQVYDADVPVTGSSFRVKHVLRVGRWEGSDEVGVLDLPYPTAGVGGGRLFASPSQDYVLFAMFSGQCEERFAVLSADDLTLVGQVPYETAECAAFAFSETESHLVMGFFHYVTPLRDRCEEAGHTEGRDFVFPAGGLVLMDLAERTSRRHSLEIVLPAGASLPAGGMETLEPRFIQGGLELSTRFGTFELSLPLPEVVRLTVSNAE